MITRTLTSTVTFAHPFRLRGEAKEFPPGAYRVIAEEELMQSLSFEAFLRLSTHIEVSMRPGVVSQVEITKADLERMVERDAVLPKAPAHGEASLPGLDANGA